jgi:hypothetical protein
VADPSGQYNPFRWKPEAVGNQIYSARSWGGVATANIESDTSSRIYISTYGLSTSRFVEVFAYGHDVYGLRQDGSAIERIVGLAYEYQIAMPPDTHMAKAANNIILLWDSNYVVLIEFPFEDPRPLAITSLRGNVHTCAIRQGKKLIYSFFSF